MWIERTDQRTRPLIKRLFAIPNIVGKTVWLLYLIPTVMFIFLYRWSAEMHIVIFHSFLRHFSSISSRISISDEEMKIWNKTLKHKNLSSIFFFQPMEVLSIIQSRLEFALLISFALFQNPFCALENTPHTANWLPKQLYMCGDHLHIFFVRIE